MKKGYIQVYTGNGKGKTTAILGLSLRATGAGLKIYIAQFLKYGEYSEIKALSRFKENIEIHQYGTGEWVKDKPSQKEIDQAIHGLALAKKAMTSEKYDIIILEEANVAVYYGVFSLEALLDFIAVKPEGVELVISGRYAAPEVIEKADLVTEMKEIKHYFHKGISARVGIEK